MSWIAFAGIALGLAAWAAPAQAPAAGSTGAPSTFPVTWRCRVSPPGAVPVPESKVLQVRVDPVTGLDFSEPIAFAEKALRSDVDVSKCLWDLHFEIQDRVFDWEYRARCAPDCPPGHDRFREWRESRKSEIERLASVGRARILPFGEATSSDLEGLKLEPIVTGSRCHVKVSSQPGAHDAQELLLSRPFLEERLPQLEREAPVQYVDAVLEQFAAQLSACRSGTNGAETRCSSDLTRAGNRLIPALRAVAEAHAPPSDQIHTLAEWKRQSKSGPDSSIHRGPWANS